MKKYLSLLFIFCGIDCFGAPTGIHLSWLHNETDTTMTVTWATALSEGTTVEYGLTVSYGQSETGSSFYSSNCGQYMHTVELTGLVPDTQYHYRCGSIGAWSADRTFYTAPSKGSDKSFVFAAFADNRTNQAPRVGIKNTLNQFNPRFSILAGDYVSNGTAQSEWNAWFGDMEDMISNSPAMVGLGNHENYAPIAPNYFHQFSLPAPATYYSFNYENTHFTCLFVPQDGTTINVGDAQYNWLVNDLQQADADTDIKWKIVYFHTPLYTITTNHPPNTSLRANIGSLLDHYRVDVVFTGHNHDYERTYLLQNSPVTVLQTGSNYTDNPHGMVHVLTGAAGAPLYTPGNKDSLTAYATGYYQGCIVTITSSTLDCRAYFMNQSVPFDQFTITNSIADDTTPPLTIAAVNDGTGTDIDFAFSSSQLSANWTASSDPESGIFGYKYAIGTHPGDTDESGWAYNSATSVTITSLALASGTTYYFTVKAVNGVGLESAAATNSDGQVVRTVIAKRTDWDDFTLIPPQPPQPPFWIPSLFYRFTGLPTTGETILKLYTVSGKPVRQMVGISGEDIIWDMTNENNHSIVPGIYVFVLTNSTIATKKPGKLIIAP
jgi:hypothetical protein